MRYIGNYYGKKVTFTNYIKVLVQVKGILRGRVFTMPGPQMLDLRSESPLDPHQPIGLVVLCSAS